MVEVFLTFTHCFSSFLPSSLPPGGVFVLPLREHDGLPVPLPAVPQLPAVPDVLLARPRQRPPQQPAPDEGALVLGEAARVGALEPRGGASTGFPWQERGSG